MTLLDEPQPTQTCDARLLGRDRLWLAAVAVAAAAFLFLAALRIKMIADLGWEGYYLHIYYNLMASYDWLGAGISLASLLGVWWLSRQEIGIRAAELLERRRITVACIAALAMFLLANVVCGGRALTQDEFAPLTQGRIFGAGKMAGEWPAEMMNLLQPSVYWNWFFVKSAGTGRFISNYSPGHALLIAPFSRLGIESASNALISGLVLLAITTIAGRLHGSRAAGAAALFTLASPVFWAYGLGFYSMPAHLLANLLFVLLMMQGSLTATGAAGTIGGFALSLHNPFPHAVFAAPWILSLFRQPRWLVRIPILVVCYAMVYVPLALGWDDYKQFIRQEGEQVKPVAAAAAEPVLSPLARVAGYVEQVRGAFQLDEAWQMLQHRLFAMMKLISWDAPALLVLACWAAWQHRRDRWTALLAASALVTVVAYAFVKFSGGHGWGYRYFYPTWGVLPILAGAAVAGSRPVPCSVAAILTAAAIAAPVAVPARLWQMHGFYACHYSQEPAIPPDAGIDLSKVDLRRLLVFVNPSKEPFRKDLVQNDPFLRTGPIRMMTVGDEMSESVARGLAAERGANPVLILHNPRGCIWYLQPIAGATRAE